MKQYPIVWIALTLTVAAALVAGLRGREGNLGAGTEVCTDSLPEHSPKAIQRSSITFILNKDPGGKAGYYTQAANYYRNHPTDKTDFVVTHLRTLGQVRDWLEIDRPSNGQPWGTVNLVVHANEWLGMASPVVEGGMRASREEVRTAAAEGEFLPLSDEIVDHETQLFVDGCGMGRDQEMLEVLSQAFGGHDLEKPLVRSSRFFLQFTRENGEWMRQQVEPFYHFYPGTVRPSNSLLAKALTEKYPDETVDWKAALKDERRSPEGKPWHETFMVPVVWTVTYPSKADRPDISTDSLKMDWIYMQPELLAAVAETGLTEDQFDWTVEKVIHTWPDGKREPAIKAIARCTVLTVLRTVTLDGHAYLAPRSDERYYAASGQTEEHLIAAR